MNPLRIFLLAALVLVVFSANDVDAENEPVWSFEADEQMGSLSISADGEYIAAISLEKLHLFSKNNYIPLWSADSIGIP